MAKNKAAQLSMFTAGEELPIFTGGVYGSGVVPFVEREEAKQAAMFAVTFGELAGAEQQKKETRSAFCCPVCNKPGKHLHGNGRYFCDDHDSFGAG